MSHEKSRYPKPEGNLSNHGKPGSEKLAADAEKGVLQEGDHVRWGDSEGAHGTIEQTFDQPVHKTFKGTEISIDASADKPAVLITTDKGDQTLKKASDVKPD